MIHLDWLLSDPKLGACPGLKFEAISSVAPESNLLTAIFNTHYKALVSMLVVSFDMFKGAILCWRRGPRP